MRRERAKSKNEKLFFEKVDSIGFDGGQDATLAVDKINEKHFTFKILEDKLVLIKCDGTNINTGHKVQNDT